MTEEDQIKIIARGRDAKELLANPTLQEAFTTCLHTMFAEFGATNADEGATRDAIWAKFNAIGEFKQLLEGFRDAGRLEEINREQDLGRNQ